MTDKSANRLRSSWDQGQSVFGGWSSTPSPYSAEIFADLDYDYICIDMQHGLVGYDVVFPALQALRFGTSTALVRVPDHSSGWAGKALDAGAEGIIFPMINTAEQAEAVVRQVRYAPEGNRSYGPVRSGMVVGNDTNVANAHNLCIAMIETVEAVGNADAICGTPGVDAIYVGPADLAVTMGMQPSQWYTSDAHREARAEIIAAGDRAGIPVGIHCADGPMGVAMAAEGFAMMTVVTDTTAIIGTAKRELAAVRGGDVSATGLYG